jgi:hypothetical protein
VDVKPDDWTCFADLRVTDYSERDFTCGLWYGYASAIDRMYFNSYYWDGQTVEYRKECAAHEWGHAHGIGDHTSAAYEDALMDVCPVNTCASGASPMYPQAHDKVDYNELWG